MDDERDDDMIVNVIENREEDVHAISFWKALQIPVNLVCKKKQEGSIIDLFYFSFF